SIPSNQQRAMAESWLEIGAWLQAPMVKPRLRNQSKSEGKAADRKSVSIGFSQSGWKWGGHLIGERKIWKTKGVRHEPRIGKRPSVRPPMHYAKDWFRILPGSSTTSVRSDPPKAARATS